MMSKIDNYTISLQKVACKICVRNGDKEWLYTTKKFESDGMKIFPKALYTLICSELKHANIYDKFLDKYYAWVESDE